MAIIRLLRSYDWFGMPIVFRHFYDKIAGPQGPKSRIRRTIRVMKKFIAFVAAAIMAFALCACEKKRVPDAVTTNVSAVEAPTETLEAETEIETVG